MTRPIGFFAPGFNVSAWHTAFAALDPSVDFRAWPDWGKREEIAYALVWKPEADLFEGCSGLRAIISLGAGVDHLLAVQEHLPRGVPLVRMADPGLREFMTSFVVMSVLFHHRQMLDYGREQSKRQWQPLDAVMAKDRSVGFMGFGNMVRKAARVLKDLGHPIFAWSRTPKQTQGVVHYAGVPELPAFLSNTDILVCALPATGDTDGLLNRDTLSQLPRGAAIVNVGRGNLLVPEHLLALLEDGWLSGATLDVFLTEPLPAESPLWEHPRVVITPHIASPSLPESVAQYTLQIIEDFERGSEFPNQVSLDRGY